MALNFTPVGQEIQVNASALDNAQFTPDAAALADGRFAVVNTREFASNDWDINLQYLNADGTLSGSRLLVDNDAGFQYAPAVASRPGGGAVVIWVDENGKDGAGNSISHAIQLRVVSNAGVMSTPFTVADGTSLYGLPDVASLADGRIMAVYQETIPALGVDVRLRVVNPAGDVVTLSYNVTLDGDSGGPAIAVSGNNALIVFDKVAGGDIGMKLFNGSTATLSASAIGGNLVASSGYLLDADVAALTDGRYIVVWSNNSNGDIEGRFVDAAGNATGSVFTLSDANGLNATPRVAALPDGGFIVTWDNDGGVIAPENGGDRAVLARRFDPTGAAAGDLFLVNTADPDTAQYRPAIAVNRTTGEAFIAWTDDHVFAGAGQDNDPPGIRGRAFIATTDVVNGTPGNDTLVTYSLSETINGLAGNDTIFAVGGNDAVDGGEGSDLLFGGIGDDTLAGGEGADTLNGEDGNDLINGGFGNDSLAGGPGADRFLFNTAIKKKANNVDTIADFSAADDTILLDNAIFKKLKTEGVLKAKFFEVGKKAKSGKDAIIYNDKKGTLVYDKNGDKKGGAVLFAKLEGSPDDLSAADFLVI